jgi:hypothetical protein
LLFLVEIVSDKFTALSTTRSRVNLLRSKRSKIPPFLEMTSTRAVPYILALANRPTPYLDLHPKASRSLPNPSPKANCCVPEGPVEAPRSSLVDQFSPEIRLLRQDQQQHPLRRQYHNQLQRYRMALVTHATSRRHQCEPPPRLHPQHLPRLKSRHIVHCMTS